MAINTLFFSTILVTVALIRLLGIRSTQTVRFFLYGWPEEPA